MKRLGNLYEKICSMENLRAAELKARKGKRHQPGVREFLKNAESNLFQLHEILINKSYKTSAYTVFKVYEPKEREVYRLPYFPDRIMHHAIMNVLEKMFMSVFTADTYSCIKGKGIHGASFALRRALNDKTATKYCLKLDIKKFYPSVDHNVLKSLLRRKIKDKELLDLLDEIIDSADGLPIGNYLSQYFANFYLSYFDHWLKEVKKVKYYLRYCDDLVILGPQKPELHQLLAEIRIYLADLKLTIKDNYQVFPVKARGIDFVGYVHFHDNCVFLRKTIKQNFARAVSHGKRPSVASYYGWAKHCNAKNLLKKLLMKNFSDLGIKRKSAVFVGDKVKIRKIMDQELIIHDYKIEASKFEGKGNGNRLCLQLELDGKKCIIFTGSVALQDMITQVEKPDGFPFRAKIVEVGESFEFQ